MIMLPRFHLIVKNFDLVKNRQDEGEKAAKRNKGELGKKDKFYYKWVQSPEFKECL